MATKIKDSATAQRAALNLDKGIETAVKSEPNAPVEKTTSEKLFPEFMTDDGGVINRPVKPYSDTSKPLPVAATPEASSQDQKPETQTPTQKSYLTPDQMENLWVKRKVDGIEEDVPAKEALKAHQLERHLNTQLMNLAQERKSLEDERRRLQATPPPLEPKPAKTEPAVKKTAQEEALEARIAQMQAQMEQLQQTMLPAIQESGIKRVEKMVKDRIGTDDFRAYFDKIRDQALSEIGKPELANNPQARAYFDSDAYYFQTYQEMKLKEMISKPSTPVPSNSNAPVLQTQQGAPVVMNNQGQPVSIPTFESSGGVPSKSSPDASWQSTYNTLFQRAQESGRQEDWQALYRHKIRIAE